MDYKENTPKFYAINALKELTTQIAKETTVEVAKMGALKPSIMYDIPEIHKENLDGHHDGTGMSTMLPPLLKNDLVDIDFTQSSYSGEDSYRDWLRASITKINDNESYPENMSIRKDVNREWKKIWEESTLIQTTLEDESYDILDHEPTMKYFYKKLEEASKLNGANFYVFTMQAWVTEFIESSFNFSSVSDMPLDDREMGAILMTTVKGNKTIDIEYAPIKLKHFSETGGEAHTGRDGKECTCTGEMDIGIWKQASTPSELVDGKEVIIW